jgi:hypothetical protein
MKFMIQQYYDDVMPLESGILVTIFIFFIFFFKNKAIG